MNNKIGIGVEYCDDIGDVFHNPALLGFIQNYYRQEYGQSLRIYSNKKQKIFSPDFYNFIRFIFETDGIKQDFFMFVRESYIGKPEKFHRLFATLEREDFVTGLLSLEEVSEQLFYHRKSTIEGIFKTRIVDILKKSHETLAYDPEDAADSMNGYMLNYSLSQILEKGIFPIGPNGEILCYLKDTKDGYSVCGFGEKYSYEIDKDTNKITEAQAGKSLIASKKNPKLRVIHSGGVPVNNPEGVVKPTLSIVPKGE